MSNFSNSLKQQHPFHLVTPSPWPFLTSFSFLALVMNIVLYMHYWREKGFINILMSLFCMMFCVYRWFSDVMMEATFEGNHTQKVQTGLKNGMLLFIVSEIMFFFAFFWAFFHSSLIPSIFIGAVFPPFGMEVLNPWGLPFLNTVMLLSSGVSMTWAHSNIIAGRHIHTIYGLSITIFLGLIFTCFQLTEYIEAPFSINSGMYGSVFFLATGFHGFHVMIGTMFLLVCFFSQLCFHFTKEHHLGFEAAAWYWHFVDVVWLFLFTTMYWWGS